MKPRNATLLLLTLIVVGLSVSLIARQVAARSNVWGYVRDADTSKPINGALFEAIPQAQDTSTAKAYTDDQGYFELTATPGKVYRFKASANGYLPKETGDITVPTDRDLPFDNFLLQKAPTQGFVIQTLSGNQAVVAGEKVTYRLVLIAAPQFSGTVSIGVRSSIASTGYQILPDNNVPLSSQSNLTISVIVSTERSTQPGTYNFIVTATSGELTQTSLMTLTVYAAPQTLQEQIMAATVSATPLIAVCGVSVVVGFLIGRRRSKPSNSDE
jgi:hypothetical protein